MAIFENLSALDGAPLDESAVEPESQELTAAIESELASR